MSEETKIEKQRSVELEGVFKRGNAGQYVEEARETMNFLEKWKFDFGNHKEIRKQVSKIAKDALMKQREQMEHKLMLSLDAEKKRLFAEYVKHVDGIQQDMVVSSAKAENSLTEIMYEAIDTAIGTQMDRLEKLSSMKSAGRIRDEEYDEEYSRVMKWSKLSRENVDVKVALIMTKQAEAFEKTIELFKSEHGI